MVTDLNIQIYGDNLETIIDYLYNNKLLNLDDDWQNLNTIDYNENYIHILGECKDIPIEYFWVELSINNNVYIEFSNSKSNSGIIQITNGEIIKKELLSYYEYLYYYDNDYFWNEIEFNIDILSQTDLIDKIGEFYDKINEEDKETISDLYFNKLVNDL
jgi:hypothetical protein